MPAFFTFLTRILPAFRAKVYPHYTRILAKSDPRQIVATLKQVCNCVVCDEVCKCDCVAVKDSQLAGQPTSASSP